MNHPSSTLKFLSLSLLVLLAGCGPISSSSYYNYSPTFMRDGKILFIQSLESSSKDVFGQRIAYSYSEYVKSIYKEATGESAALFTVTNDPAYYMSCSPNRDYAAYMTGLSGTTYSKIIIQNIAAGSHSGLETIEMIFNPRIIAFDWSSNGNQIVYATTNEVHVRDWNDYTGATDALVTREANLEYVSWKYGSRIAVSRKSGSDYLLTMISTSGADRTDLLTAASVQMPQISPVNTSEVFGLAGTGYYKVDYTAATPALTLVKAGFSGAVPCMSTDASRITYSKAGQSTGVYVLYLGTATEEVIKQ